MQQKVVEQEMNDNITAYTIAQWESPYFDTIVITTVVKQEMNDGLTAYLSGKVSTLAH